MRKVKVYKSILGAWANQMATRFNSPVYLVGSALEEENPRDIDVRIVIDDHQFKARYGSVDEWEKELWLPEWGKVSQKVSRDMAKLGHELTCKIRLNIDLQIQPLSHVLGFYEKQKRVRLDGLNFITQNVLKESEER